MIWIKYELEEIIYMAIFLLCESWGRQEKTEDPQLSPPNFRLVNG